MNPAFEPDRNPAPADPRPPRRPGDDIVTRIANAVVVLAILCLVALLLMPAVSHSHESALRLQCANNLKKIALALEAYQQRYGVFPPPYVADANGRPMHSWRVLILPFLEQTELYHRYDLGSPWDGPRNIALLGEKPGVYACPHRRGDRGEVSSYAVITGPGTMFPDGGGIKLADVTDGLAGTLMVVETTTAEIPWTQPIDLDIRTMGFRINDPIQPSISSRHPGGAQVVYGDRHVHFLKATTGTDRLRSAITIAGGESLPHGEGSAWD